MPADPSKGHAVLRLFDCGSAPAVNVVLTTPTSGALVRYADVSDPLAVNKPATDASGFAAVFNVEPGFVGFEIKDASSGALLMTATLEIRSSTLTYATVAPH